MLLTVSERCWAETYSRKKTRAEYATPELLGLILEEKQIDVSAPFLGAPGSRGAFCSGFSLDLLWIGGNVGTLSVNV